jgi:hypothetical protein
MLLGRMGPSGQDIGGDFEAWARLAARLRHRNAAERTALLAEAGLDEASWTPIHEGWSAQLNGDITAGRLERPRQYAQICAADLACRRRAEAPAVDPPDERPSSEPPTVPHPQIEPVPAAHGSRPDFREHLTPPHAPQAPQRGQLKTQPLIAVGGAAVAATTDFRNRLTPLGAGPEPPAQGQLETHTIDPRATVASAIMAAQAVERWTVADYARLCGALERCRDDSERQRLWAETGITGQGEQHWVRDQWERRLAAEPALYSQFRALLARA